MSVSVSMMARIIQVDKNSGQPQYQAWIAWAVFSESFIFSPARRAAIRAASPETRPGRDEPDGV